MSELSVIYMKKNTVISLLVIVVISLVVSFLYIGSINKKSQSNLKEESNISVVASFYPLHFFASQIAGNKANVINLTPAGAEPHDFEPSTKDVGIIENSDLVLINGVGFEPWAEKIKGNLKNSSVIFEPIAEGLANMEIVEEGELIRDPHVWLDPVLAKQQVLKISQLFTEIDPQNEAMYAANSKNLTNQLDELNRQFEQGLSQCSQKEFITSHSAFTYLASRYGIKQVSIAGLSPDQEPSPKELAEVTSFAKANNVKYIFFETLVSPRLSQAVAQEIGAQTLVLNPLEGIVEEEQKAGRNYFTVQEENLKNLKIALQCK